MLKLMKLELQRINLRPYIVSSAIFAVILLIFNYFVAYVAQVEQETEFMTYTNIFRFTGAISIILFGVQSAAMYARLVISEYSGKRLALLFSYPVSRKKIFMAKVLIVFAFVLISMFLCTMLSTVIFAVTEAVSPIAADTMTSDLLLNVFKILAVSSIAVSAIGLAALRIGFIKKSVSATLISSFALSAFYGYIAVGETNNLSILMLITVVSMVVIFAVIFTLANKINNMEVD